jgi:hypothetical protein
MPAAQWEVAGKQRRERLMVPFSKLPHAFKAHNVETTSCDIDADCKAWTIELLNHGVLFVLEPLPVSTAGGAGAPPDHPIRRH